MLTRPGHQGVGTRPWTQQSLAKSHLTGRVKWSVRGVVGLALGLMLTSVWLNPSSIPLSRFHGAHLERHPHAWLRMLAGHEQQS